MSEICCYAIPYLATSRPYGRSGGKGMERNRGLKLRSVLKRGAPQSQLALQRFFPRILDGQQDGIGVHDRLVAREDTRELGVGGQFTLLELRPHLARKLGFE